MTKSVLIVNDRPVMRQGLESLLGGNGSIEVIGSTGDREQALDLVAQREPDVVLVDGDISEFHAEVLVSDLIDQDSEIWILLLCDGTKPVRLKQCVELGVRGCISKSGSYKQLSEAIATVATGGKFFDERLSAVTDRTSRGKVLTEREAEVFTLLAQGLTGADIAKRLWLSPETVRTHIRNAMSRLDANTRTPAVVVAVERGEIETNG